MRRIEVTVGAVGVLLGQKKKYAVKTAKDGPFDCDDAQAARFVRLGVAKYVDAAEASAEDPVVATDLQAMTIAQLKNMADDLGIDVDDCKKKSDYIDAIMAHCVQPPVLTDEDDEQPPVLTAEDPV